MFKTNTFSKAESSTTNDYLQLYRKFADSPVSEPLRGKGRFSRYRPRHVDPKDWVKLLGQYADMLAQAEATYADAQELTTGFAKLKDRGALDEKERNLLLLAAVTYNWGKADTGDIAYEQKTANDEEAERQAWRRYYSQLVDTNPKTLSQLETTIFEASSPTGKAFSAVKRMGYIKTALRAMKASKEAEDPILVSHLRWLAAGVLSNQVHLILEYQDLFEPFKNWLDGYRDGISEIFDSLGPEIFAQHGQAESQYRELYQRSQADWQASNTGDGNQLTEKLDKLLADPRLSVVDPALAREIKDATWRLLNLDRPNTNTAGETFNKGIFGPGSNFESRYIPDWQQLEKTVHALRDVLGLKIVLTSGTFDIKHLGHDKYLEKASQQGDILIVGVDNDAKVRAKKGPNRPVVDERQRLEELVHARGVGIVTLKPPMTEKWALIKVVRPDTLVVTTEHYHRYSQEELVELKQYVGRVVALPPQSESSTTARIRRLHIDFSKKLQEELPGLIDKLINNA